jgi:hypothetical protein
MITIIIYDMRLGIVSLIDVVSIIAEYLFWLQGRNAMGTALSGSASLATLHTKFMQHLMDYQQQRKFLMKEIGKGI